MKVILKNHNEQYAVREIINSYFPKIKINYESDIPCDEDYILSQIIQTKNGFKYETEYVTEKKTFTSAVEHHCFSKNKIKKSISDCLKSATNINLPWGLLTGIRPAKMVREYLESNEKHYSSPNEFLINEYETSTDKASLAVKVEKNEEKYLNNINPKRISLYVGIPFCPTRCLYCSFTSQSIAFSNKLTDEYTECLIKEICEISKTNYIKQHEIESVYFGGGTPTALSADQIDLILNALFQNFNLSKIKEFTFEAGRPDTIDEKKLSVLKKYSISRISINPQTVSDKTLKIIGRNHTCNDFINAFNLARKMGFEHINCDIIAGLPEEELCDFKNTLKKLSELKPESITVHTMCIKHGSFLDMKYDMYSMTAANTVNSMLEYAHKKLENMNMLPYYIYRQKNMLGNLENVGYCKPGHECIYNIYIMEEVQSIVALGGGASTKLVNGNNIERSFNVKEVSEYIKRIDEMIDRKICFFKSFREIVLI